MKRIMKSYRLTEWELENIERLKILLEEKYKVEFTATDVVCRAINELFTREHREHMLLEKGEL